jgi:5S rRNA maturation endonuclease (ribonuclease M5)
VLVVPPLVRQRQRDKEALKKLGILNVTDISGSSMDMLVKRLDKSKKHIILTDYDLEGERKNKEICNFLQKLKFKVDLRFRGLLKSCFGITKVEELIKFSKNKEDDYNGEISAINDKIFNRSRFHRKRLGGETGCNRCYIWSN